jgi:hypothetical protein
MKPRYIAHTGKKQPVDDGTIVDVVFSDGIYIHRCRAGAFGPEFLDGLDWWLLKDHNPNAIIAYRVIEQEG